MDTADRGRDHGTTDGALMLSYPDTTDGALVLSSPGTTAMMH